MSIKELKREEVAMKLATEGIFEGYVRNGEKDDWDKTNITGIDFKERGRDFLSEKCGWWRHCGIEIHPEYEPYPDDEMPDLKRLDGITSKQYNVEHTITSIDKKSKDLTFVFVHLYGWISNKRLFDDFTHIDGSPIGRLKGSGK